MKIKHGFTLLEILIVVFIMGILATLVVSNFGPANVNAENQAAQAQLRIIYAAANSFRVENNKFPNTLAELVTNPSNPNVGGYIQNPNLAGSWTYALSGSTNSVTITATGKANTIVGPPSTPAIEWRITGSDGTSSSNF